jgi:DNA-directed RNA polymerase specialized sigma24 family protein
LPARQVALEIVDQDYARLRPDVLRALRGRLNKQRWHWHFNDCDLDEYYNKAWEALYAALCDGVEIENPTGYLVRVAYNRAIDETRTAWSTHVVADELVIDASVDDDDVAAGDARGAQHTVVYEAGDAADYEEAIDRRALVRHLRAQMKVRLTERECQAATLCLIQDWTRPQAARLLRIPETRMERIMDLVMRKLPTIAVPVAAQRVCPSRAATIRAYALGRLDVGSSCHGDAAAHIACCAECARFCAAVGNLAAVWPPPVALQASFAPHTGRLPMSSLGQREPHGKHHRRGVPRHRMQRLRRHTPTTTRTSASQSSFDVPRSKRGMPARGGAGKRPELEKS